MLAWLAAHLALLALVLGLKFLGAKAVAALLLLAGLFWLAARREKRPLPRLARMV